MKLLPKNNSAQQDPTDTNALNALKIAQGIPQVINGLDTIKLITLLILEAKALITVLSSELTKIKIILIP